MDKEEFLLQRLAEAEQQLVGVQQELWQRLHNVISTQRHIIHEHRNWPVLVEEPPTMESDYEIGQDVVVVHMTQRIAWLTQVQYRKVFGKEAPTSPFINDMLQAYKTHPDFKDEWIL